MMRPRLLFPVLLGALAACGARTTLEADDAPPSGGGGGAAQGGGGAGDGASGGGGAAPLACAELVWAGEPVLVDLPFGNGLGTVELVPTGDGDYGLVFNALTDALGNNLGSFPIRQPFQAWPPTLGGADVNFSTQWRFAVSQGEPTMFAFVASDSVSLILGQALPGQNGSTLITSPGSPADMLALARNDLGNYGAVMGSSLMTGFTFADLSPDIAAIEAGVLGCADVGLADVAPAGASFIAASASDQPFDDCIDPDIPGPPRYVQTYGFDASGSFRLGDFLAFDDPVTELRLAARPGGAWLGVQTLGAGSFDVYAVEEDLSIAKVPTHFVSGRTTARHALAAAGDTFALAEVVRTIAGPDSGLIVAIEVDHALVSLSGDAIGAVPMGEPSIVASPDGRSLLVAWLDAASFAPSVVIARADCLGD